MIRGHRVYKETWNPLKGEKLMCNHDKREEAKIFEDHAVGTYKDSLLVGHVPFELSFLFCKFIKKSNDQIFSEDNGGRKLENDLVVPCIFHVNGIKIILKHFRKTDTYENKEKAIDMNIKKSEIRKRTFL